MLNHFINKTKINAILRFFTNSCEFVLKILPFLRVSSAMLSHVLKIINDIYGMDSLFDNDPEAIMARIWYVQNHEDQMREPW